jgi:DNA-binding MarR family transcriptional regulator
MSGFDELLATLPRLKVAAFLSGCEQADFTTVAAACELSRPTLSKTVVTMEEAGYVRVRKGHVGRRPRTWLSLTEEGATAFDRHMSAVRLLTEHAKQDSPG